MTRPWALTGLLGLVVAHPLSGQTGSAPLHEPAPIEAGRSAPSGRYSEDGIDVLHYEIELALPEGPGWVQGWASLEIGITDSIDAVRLDFTGLHVDGAAVDGTPAEGWSLDAGILRIPFGATAAPGERRSVEVSYRGVPDDGLILGQTVHGAPSAFVDNWPNRTRFWLPSVDHPSDKATSRFTVHAPAAWKVIANGRAVGPPTDTPSEVVGPAVGTRRTWVYRTDVPQPTYTLVVGGAEMVVDTVGLAACGAAPASSRSDGCIAVTTWLFPESAAAGAGSFRRAAEMVDFFTALVGPFPYEKLAHVQSATRFGGMENGSAIFYSQQGIASGRDMEGTVSHETAHQWFGDSVTPSDWGHLWLSEGFATYFGALFFEEVEGPAALRDRMSEAARRYLSSPDTARPVIDARDDLFGMLNRNSYQKGGLVLHMLRRELGDEIFFDAVRAWYTRFQNSTASTDDLQTVFQEVAGRDLGTFFDQWLRHPGYPVLEVASEAVPEGLRIQLSQVQESHAPRFRLLVDVEVTWDGGSHRTTVRMDTDVATITVPEAPANARVVLDPDGWLLHRRVDPPPSRRGPAPVG